MPVGKNVTESLIVLTLGTKSISCSKSIGHLLLKDIDFHAKIYEDILYIKFRFFLEIPFFYYVLFL